MCTCDRIYLTLLLLAEPSCRATPHDGEPNHDSNGIDDPSDVCYDFHPRIRGPEGIQLPLLRERCDQEDPTLKDFQDCQPERVVSLPTDEIRCQVDHDHGIGGEELHLGCNNVSESTDTTRSLTVNLATAASSTHNLLANSSEHRPNITSS